MTTTRAARPRRWLGWLTVAGLWLGAAATVPAEELAFLWQDVTHNLSDTDVHTVAVDPSDAARVYLGTSRALYHTSDGGRTWAQRLSLRGTDTTVRAIVVVPRQPQQVVAATDQGVFVSDDGGRRWRRGPARLKRCTTLLDDAAHPGRIWVGTTSGLYRTDDVGRTWQAVGGYVDRKPVFALGRDPFYPEQLYVATDTGILITADQGQTWRHSLWGRATGEEPAAETLVDDDAAARAGRSAAVTAIAFNPERPHEAVALTGDGALVSRDGGRTWTSLPTAGLAREPLRAAVMTHASAPRLYVASDRGVWTFDETAQRWEQLQRGLTASRVRHLAIQPLDGSLWAATDRGVFHGAALPSDAQQSPLKTWTLFQHEPTIGEVQAEAIRQSETDPAKIARWRRAAATKALLPTVSLGFDRNKNISDRYDEGTYPKFQLIPTRDIDRNWDVSVSWDLGELIWNNDQTSIDSRSKLTTELREQILSEATRLYFERRRLQMEMALAPLEDPKLALEQDLRVQELTAQLDALTGGWFSRALEGS